MHEYLPGTFQDPYAPYQDPCSHYKKGYVGFPGAVCEANQVCGERHNPCSVASAIFGRTFEILGVMQNNELQGLCYLKGQFHQYACYLEGQFCWRAC